MMQTQSSKITILFSALLTLCLPASHAENLMQVYDQALKNDPTYQNAIATWQSAKVNLPIARSYLLPTITTEADYGRTNSKLNPSKKSVHTYTTSLNATLTQPLLDFDVWNSVKAASYSVKAATATYFAAQQTLMQSVTTAYFNVLTASEKLVYDQALKAELYNQLVTNKQKYKVGLSSSVDVYTTQASYDTQVAQEIADKNALKVSLESLTALTNHSYRSLVGIKNAVPLVPPKPANINQWVDTSVEQNYSLQAQQATTLYYKKLIGVEVGSALPTAYGSLSANHAYDTYTKDSTTYKPTTTTAGIAISYSPFTGGLNMNNIKQARYNYLAQSSLLEYTYRGIVQSTRTAYLGVMSDISQVKANQQTVISSQKSLEATQAGYKVGTQSIDDVLTSLSTLNSSQVSYITNQYSYLSNLISLKMNAGTLSEQDLAAINKWLTKTIVFSKLLDTQDNTVTSTPANATKKPTQSTNKQTTPRTTAKTTKASTNKGQYAIQLYAAKQYQQAQQFQQSTSLTTHIIHSSPWYKVVYGSFNNAKTANAALASIKATNHDAWVVKVPMSKTITTAQKAPAKLPTPST